VCIVGIGNRLKADDGAGPALIDLLEERPGRLLVDAGVAPENYVEKIARMEPDTVLLVDAMDLGARPGHHAVFRPGDLAAGGISSHAGSLELVADYLRNRTNATIHVLGIQPGSLQPGAGLSPPVRAAVRDLADVLQS
jgi:hydrogenase 3 maturation protease